MLYPLYVWKDTNSALGAAFPALPGVFGAADDLADLPAMRVRDDLSSGRQSKKKWR